MGLEEGVKLKLEQNIKYQKIKQCNGLEESMMELFTTDCQYLNQYNFCFDGIIQLGGLYLIIIYSDCLYNINSEMLQNKLL